jgi:hypothetical protein
MEPSSADPQWLDEALSPGTARSAARTCRGARAGRRLFAALASAPGDKMIVLRFARSVSSGQLSRAPCAGPCGKLMPRRRGAHRRRGRLPGGREGGGRGAAALEGRRHSSSSSAPSTGVLAGAQTINERLWSIWLGPHSATSNLKQSIASRVAGALRGLP